MVASATVLTSAAIWLPLLPKPTTRTRLPAYCVAVPVGLRVSRPAGELAREVGQQRFVVVTVGDDYCREVPDLPGREGDSPAAVGLGLDPGDPGAPLEAVPDGVVVEAASR